jgi:hypothetical protein
MRRNRHGKTESLSIDANEKQRNPFLKQSNVALLSLVYEKGSY